MKLMFFSMHTNGLVLHLPCKAFKFYFMKQEKKKKFPHVRNLTKKKVETNLFFMYLLRLILARNVRTGQARQCI